MNIDRQKYFKILFVLCLIASLINAILSIIIPFGMYPAMAYLFFDLMIGFGIEPGEKSG